MITNFLFSSSCIDHSYGCPARKTGKYYVSSLKRVKQLKDSIHHTSDGLGPLSCVLFCSGGILLKYLWI